MAYEIRKKADGAVVYYYEGDLRAFGGPWGTTDYEQVEVPTRIPPEPSEEEKLCAMHTKAVKALANLVTVLIAKGVILEPDLSAETMAAINEINAIISGQP